MPRRPATRTGRYRSQTQAPPAAPDWLELAAPSGRTIHVRKAAHPRARHMRLTVTADGARVSYPRGTHPARLLAFVRANADWLEGKLADLRRDAVRLPPLAVGRTLHIPLRGEPMRLVWTEAAYPHIEQHDHTLRLMLPPLGARALPVAYGLLAAFLETSMRADLARWLPRYVARLGRAPVGLRIRPTRSQWGSLDSHSRINLDLALALAPPDALRYVLIHELSHLKLRNHSPAFWRQVAALYPGYRAPHDWLREHGAELKAQLDRLIGTTPARTQYPRSHGHSADGV